MSENLEGSYRSPEENVAALEQERSGIVGKYENLIKVAKEFIIPGAR